MHLCVALACSDFDTNQHTIVVKFKRVSLDLWYGFTNAVSRGIDRETGDREKACVQPSLAR